MEVGVTVTRDTPIIVIFETITEHLPRTTQAGHSLFWRCVQFSTTVRYTTVSGGVVVLEWGRRGALLLLYALRLTVVALMACGYVVCRILWRYHSGRQWWNRSVMLLCEVEHTDGLYSSWCVLRALL